MRVTGQRAAALAAALVLSQAPAHVGAVTVTTDQCVAAHLANQKLRKQGKLMAAQKELLVCVQEECPPPVRADCTEWLGETEAEMPSVVVGCKDASGKDAVAVRLTIDGQPVGETLDGRPIALDPGPHTLVCEHGGKKKTEQIVLQMGQKNRAITCDFTVAKPQAEPVEIDKGEPVAAYILGALSLGAFASFAAFAVVGENEADELDETCGESAVPPNQPNTCTEDQIQAVRNKLIVADVSLGVGVALLGVAVGLFVYHHVSDPDPAAAWRLDFGPTVGGAAGQLTVGF
jgi:hypothetical protein